ncbi:hypothetical protein Enr13x_14970 [Stieleria neptunia]|uniref:50S ribosomal protein L7/L12 n=1 Tax=Stieleria neptunia TaxID=2527979 RepID=A0A518HLC5_9BACT|nr:hypothetical protein [Stieleria neptunia]QDV41654.1 hypothetical protein Enr13x_14970 [Stieleria neptunia]
MKPLSQAQRDQIQSALKRQGKIAAVKLYKDWMECSLLEAKNAVEAIQSDPDDRGPAGTSSAERDEVMQQIDQALAEGKRLHAVKHYRKLTGKSLRECRAFVDSRINQLKANPDAPNSGPSAVESRRSGCVSVTLVLASLTISFTWAIVSQL